MRCGRGDGWKEESWRSSWGTGGGSWRGWEKWGGELSGREGEGEVGGRGGGGIEGAGEAGRSDAVHDAAGGFSGVAVALHGAEGHSGGDTGGEPEEGGGGGADRIFCEYAGAADEAGGEAGVWWGGEEGEAECGDRKS